MEDVTAQVPNLASTERAFRVATGKMGADGTPEEIIVAVAITRRAAQDNFLPLKIMARLVDADGVPITLNGTPVTIPGSVRSLAAAAVAEGTITVENEMATAAVEAVTRMQMHYVAMRAWFGVPAEPSEPDATAS